MKKIIPFIAALLFILTGCLNDSFMDKYPLDSPTAETAFSTYDNFLTYSYGLYENAFPAYDLGFMTIMNQESPTDNISRNLNKDAESPWIKGNYIVPTTGGDWDFSFIRRVNVMLDKIDNSEMTDSDKKHWRSVGYFFRAYRYSRLVNEFGDVPWIDHVLNTNETDLIYGPRLPRDTIMNHILSDLHYAEANIKSDGDGENTINTDVVLALISRVCLFEGSWQKYHFNNEAKANQYFTESARASKLLIDNNPAIMDNYGDVFISESLSGQPGILLYKPYADPIKNHDMAVMGTTTNAFFNPTRNLVDAFLCSDGKPRWSSPLFEGDQDMYKEFHNRDYRLYFNVTPPYRIKYNLSSAWSPTWDYNDNPADREYIDLMRNLTGDPNFRKYTLPIRQFSPPNGGVVRQMPHFPFYNMGQPYYVSQLGYNINKYISFTSVGYQYRNQWYDAPIFRMGEVMLNYAEAMEELGKFDQSVADQSINKLRARAHVAAMVVSEINGSFDPNRDPSVSPLMWEICRERRVELLCDWQGFRFDDLRRWKKMDYAMKKKLGMYIDKDNFIYADPNFAFNQAAQNGASIDGGGRKGYLEYLPAPDHTFPDYYYLYPIPLNDLTLNDKLVQNPGWDAPNNN